MTELEAQELHKIILADGAQYAANYALKKAGQNIQVSTEQQGNQALTALYLNLLNQGKNIETGYLLWGPELFEPRPRSVQLIWKSLDIYEFNLVVGGGAVGKTYTPCFWFLMFWIHDPAFTSVKVVSVTSEHAAANVMATLKSLHESSVIPLPGRRKDKFIDLGTGDKRASISQVNIPAGTDIKGRMRGFHTISRPTTHPLFGTKSRIGVVIDEGEDVAEGIWEGLENLRSSEVKGTRHIIIFSGANPKKRHSAFAQRCEPHGGWSNFDIETSVEWEGPQHLGLYHVTRLDPAKTENIVEKREVYPNFMTYESWSGYMAKGSSHPDAMTFGRGAWPDDAAEYRVTPLDYFKDAYGTLAFAENPINVASLDPAFSPGGDTAVLTNGRYGRAMGYYTPEQQFIKFPQLLPSLQIEQQIMVPKDNALVMTDYVINLLRSLRVSPEFFIIDKTGNGIAIHDPMKIKYGDILGQMWTDAPTEKKILMEDTMTPEELYRNIITEMAFAFAQWLQYGRIKISPMVGKNLQRQATNRSYLFHTNGTRILEDKNSYKARNKEESPGEYDSAIQLVHLVRMRVPMQQVLPSSVGIGGLQQQLTFKMEPTGESDKSEYIDINV